uniref:K Homology domain-containing protein n=1 Tax=Alexandrium monilatum TaxID=311494 RepID=A0A7S4Q537_9DINO
MIGPPAKRARLDSAGGASVATLAAEAAASSAVSAQGAAGGDALSLVVALLAAAGSNAVPIPALTQALALLQGASAVSSASNAAAAAAAAAQAQAAQAAHAAAVITAAAQPLTTEILPEDCVQIPNSCVGWLKGRQGGMIRDIELRSGAQCEIDQTTKDFGYSTAIVRGTAEQKKTARGLIIAEVAKVMDQSGSEFDGSFLGTKEEFHIESQYVGWLKGPKGKVIQDLQLKSGTRIEVDQSSPQLGYATVKIFGTPEGVAQARSLVAHELSKIGPEAAAHIARALPETAANETPPQQSLTDYLSGGLLGGALGGLAGLAAVSQQEALEDSVMIPNAYVGWLKGRQGGMIRDIESRSGTQIDIDQSTKDLGYSVARLRGTSDQKKTARGLVIGEIAKVMEQSGEVLDPNFPGRKEELRIDGQYIGWLKGPKGKVVQDLQVRSATRIEVDQTHPHLGYAIVKIFGTVEGILQARELIAAELSKVSPEAAASISSQLQGLEGLGPEQPPDHPLSGSSNSAADPQTLRASLMALARSSSMHIPGLTDDATLISALAGTPAGAALGIGLGNMEPQEVEQVRVPNSCVGWLKGRNGAMIREIENRSQARIDIDQSTSDMGYSLANIRGDTNQRRVGSGLVIAEIAKVMDQSGEQLDESFGGCKMEFQIDSQYVGWLKGPRGKVVQDLQLRSGTRIDVDQSNPHLGYATVKVYGNREGTQQARSLIAAELSKAGPRKATMVEVNPDSGSHSHSGDSLGGLTGLLRQVSGDSLGCASGLQGLLAQAALPNLSLLAAAAGAPPLANPAALLQQQHDR